MALKIKWSKKAKNRYQNIIEYLNDNWTEKEVIKFIQRTDSLIKTIAANPLSFQASSKKDIRKAVIGKQNSLFYRIDNDHIYLLTFWDNCQNPAKSKH